MNILFSPICQTEASFYFAMRDDYLATDRCNFDIMKTNYMELQLVWGFPKKSPYINDFNKGTMILREAGLIPHWLKATLPDVSRCLLETKEKLNTSPETNFKPLSLINLNGAFIVLGIGYVAAFFVFIGEKIMFRYLLKENINEMKLMRKRQEMIRINKEQMKHFW